MSLLLYAVLYSFCLLEESNADCALRCSLRPWSSFRRFDSNNDQNPPKDYRIVGALEKAPPYGYVVTVTFPKGVTESQFASVKETLTQLGNGAFGVASDSQTAKLLSSYFGKSLTM